MCVESATFGASKTESSSSEETVKSQESVSTDICSKQTYSEVKKENAQHQSHREDQKHVGAPQLSPLSGSGSDPPAGPSGTPHR